MSGFDPHIASLLIGCARDAALLFAVGTIALAVDRFARWLATTGAEPDTLRLFKWAAKWLLRLTLFVLLCLAATGAIELLVEIFKVAVGRTTAEPLNL
jgi:hypothetical protein